MTDINVPLKIDAPNGTPYTICLKTRPEMIRLLRSFHYVLELMPHIQFVLFKEKKKQRNLLDRKKNSLCLTVLRNVRYYSRQPTYSFIDFLIGLWRGYRKIWVNTRDNPETREFSEFLYKNFSLCWMPVSTNLLPKSVLKFDNACLSGFHRVHKDLYSLLLKTLFREKSLHRFIREDIFIDALGLNWIPEINCSRQKLKISSETTRLLEIYSLITYSLIERNMFFQLKHPERNNFDLIIDYNINSLMNHLLLTNDESETKWLIEWFLINYGSYSSLAHYQLTNLYSTVYGIEIPPRSSRTYSLVTLQPSKKRDLLIPLVESSIETYGYHDEDTLSRYTTRWWLDSNITAAAIDFYSTHFLEIPWIRAAVHSSFIRTILGSLNIYDRNLWFPIVIPAITNPEYLDDRIKYIPVPITSWRAVDPLVREYAQTFLQIIGTLSSDTNNKMPSDVVEAAFHVLESLRNNIKNALYHEFNNLSSLMRNEGTDEDSCVKGILVDAYHPIASNILIDEYAERSVAEYPSIGLTVNLIRILMERLTGTDKIFINYYLIIDSIKMLEDLQHESEMSVHSFLLYDPITNSSALLSSYNLERILKKSLIKYQKSPKDTSTPACLERIIQISDVIWDKVRVF